MTETKKICFLSHMKLELRNELLNEIIENYEINYENYNLRKI